MTEETTEIKETKETKTKKSTLPKEFRFMAISSLENSGDMKADEYNDDELLKEYNKYVLGMQKKVNNYEASHETKSINLYIAQAENSGNLKVHDKEFIMRLFKLNVPSFYLHLFKDADKDLGDREIWAVINKSGISPVKENAELAKMRRSPVKPKAVR